MTTSVVVLRNAVTSTERAFLLGLETINLARLAMQAAPGLLLFSLPCSAHHSQAFLCGFWAKVLLLAQQASYQLSHPSNPQAFTFVLG